jgi:predicted house-cleaning NTP pyrophosphatase (Maf/HAM1 superfamily)
LLDLDGTVFHKPADRAGAAAHLARLQGRTHALHSGMVEWSPSMRSNRWMPTPSS